MRGLDLLAKAIKISMMLIVASIIALVMAYFSYKGVMNYLTSIPMEKHQRLYELDGVGVRRQDRNGRTILEYIKSGKVVDKAEVTLGSSLVMYYQYDSTVFLDAQKVKRSKLQHKRKRFFITEEDMLNIYTTSEINDLKNALKTDQRSYRLENVSWECEDTLYNNRKDNPTKVKVTVLGVTNNK